LEKLGIFIDGSWLFHVTKHLKDSYQLKLLYQRIPGSLGRYFKTNNYNATSCEVHFYGSLPENTSSYDNSRQQKFYTILNERFGFHTHIFKLTRCESSGKFREKQVDVAIATDMLDFSRSYDVIAFVGGDQDFLPVLTRIHAKGKKLLHVGYNDQKLKYCPTSSVFHSAKCLQFPTFFINEHIQDLCVPVLPITANRLIA
jgi:uncharacterized LabA/DUF88 family protein